MIYVAMILVSSVSVDCPDMKILALGLRMDVKQPTLYSQLLSDCCAVTGIVCVNSRVTGISFISKLFDGTINATAIPSTVTSIQLKSMAITGSFPLLPSGVTMADFGSNLLTGSLPNLPASLTALYFNTNSISGPLPPLPSGLTILSFFTNSVSGSLPSSLPVGLTSLVMGNNLMSGTVPDIMPSVLRTIRFNGNHFSGPIPTSFATQIDFQAWGGFNKFTGILILNKPKTFNIQDNLITDVIITDTSVMTQCVLTNNPMLESSNVAALGTKCVATGLYTLVVTNLILTTIATSYDTVSVVPTMTYTCDSPSDIDSQLHTYSIVDKELFFANSDMSAQHSDSAIRSILDQNENISRSDITRSIEPLICSWVPSSTVILKSKDFSSSDNSQFLSEASTPVANSTATSITTYSSRSIFISTNGQKSTTTLLYSIQSSSKTSLKSFEISLKRSAAAFTDSAQSSSRSYSSASSTVTCNFKTNLASKTKVPVKASRTSIAQNQDTTEASQIESQLSYSPKFSALLYWQLLILMLS
eukprot:NODE_703_length_5018_cov_0.326286.p1 type:complete len:531 gc:universal NODE_703_length_5018_cov_0.326286:4405-2813(-)